MELTKQQAEYVINKYLMYNEPPIVDCVVFNIQIGNELISYTYKGLNDIIESSKCDECLFTCIIELRNCPNFVDLEINRSWQRIK